MIRNVECDTIREPQQRAGNTLAAHNTTPSVKDDAMPHRNLVAVPEIIKGKITYFVCRTSGGPIKIGRTGNLAERIWKLESDYQDCLICIGFFYGDREREMHDQFSWCRIGRGEWFEPTQTLMDFIENETITARRIARAIG